MNLTTFITKRRSDWRRLEDALRRVEGSGLSRFLAWLVDAGLIVILGTAGLCAPPLAYSYRPSKSAPSSVSSRFLSY